MSRLRFRYHSRLPARELSAEGEFNFTPHASIFAIMGRSGVGKTSLVRWMAGLGRNEDSGELRFDDAVWFDSSHSLSPRERGVGLLSQRDFLFPHLTVKKNIEHGAHGLGHAERDSRVAELLKLINLQDRASLFPKNLSGGERRRVALAQMLMIRPRLLILDEPFTGLDATTKQLLLTDTRRWLESLLIPTLMITHDLAEAQAFTSAVYTYENDRLRI